MSQDVYPSVQPRFPVLVLTVLAPFGLGYFLSYLYRAVNAVVAPDLVRDLGLTAGELGLLTAAYLIGFAGFQLPLGVLLDRYGPRRVQTAELCLAAAGACVFSLAQGLLSLWLARALIGIGSAGGLMAGFKAVSVWVREDRRALANASIMAVGGLGILFATIPAEWASQAFGWRGMFLGLSLLTLLVAGLLFLLVPESPPAQRMEPLSQQVRVIGRIYSDPIFWRIAPLVAATAGTNIGVQTLWAGPWFADVAGLERFEVAEHLALMAIGFFIGTLFSGAVADWLGRRGIGLLWVMAGFLVIYMIVQSLIIMEWLDAMLPLWFIFGMIGQVGILAYPWLAMHYGARNAGRSNAAMNTLTFLSASLSQFAIGAIIDLWPTVEGGGYHPDAYRWAFGTFLALQVVAFLWFIIKVPKRPGNQSE